MVQDPIESVHASRPTRVRFSLSRQIWDNGFLRIGPYRGNHSCARPLIHSRNFWSLFMNHGCTQSPLLTNYHIYHPICRILCARSTEVASTPAYIVLFRTNFGWTVSWCNFPLVNQCLPRVGSDWGNWPSNFSVLVLEFSHLEHWYRL